MCGIFGFIRSNPMTAPYEKFMLDGLVTGTVRGDHGTGLVAVGYNRQLSYSARSEPGYVFAQRDEVAEMFGTKHQTIAAIAHNRWATTGQHVDEHCHPFTYDHITGVHNGSVPSFMLDELTDTRHPVDSARIFAAIAEADSPLSVLSKINEGAYALVWYNKNTHSVFMARNTARPLHVLSCAGGLTFASEAGMLSWLAGRHSLYLKGAEMSAIDIHTLYEFPLDDLEQTTATKYEVTPPRYFGYTWGNGREWPKSNKPKGINKGDDDSKLFCIRHTLEGMLLSFPHLSEEARLIQKHSYKEFTQENSYTIDVLVLGRAHGVHNERGFYGVACAPHGGTAIDARVPIFLAAPLKHEFKHYQRLLKKGAQENPESFPVIPALLSKIIITADGGMFVHCTSKGAKESVGNLHSVHEGTVERTQEAIVCDFLKELTHAQIKGLWESVGFGQYRTA